MSKERPTNVAASIRQRLLNLAKQRGEEFQFTLSRYAAERLLARLTQSEHADRFILKGAMLFELWTGQPHRSTLDIDLLATSSEDVERLVVVFREIAAINAKDDGIVIDPASVRGESIREDERYGGVRITMAATLAGARVPVQVDIGFGDAVVPGPIRASFPTLLGSPRPALATYPRETAVAEKLEAMVSLGLDNSRMKDFYDLYVLAQRFEFEGDTLADAIAATFARRQTMLPSTPPVALTDEFALDPTKAKQWTAFVKRGRPREAVPPLRDVIRHVATFVSPAVEAARDVQRAGLRWSAGRWS